MYTLSIILNLHREGILVERTIKNLQHVLKFAKKKSNNWESVEVVAVLDNPDDVTKDIVKNHKELFSKIELVDYRDLADSRNHGVRCSSGNFILFADGDDYVSHNALVSVYKVLYKHYSCICLNNKDNLENLPYSNHVAVFPYILVEFPKLLHMHYCLSNELIKRNNQFIHCYNSKICLARSVIEKNLIRRNSPPYGYEDWDLNNRLLSLGVNFILAKYKLYYRRENVGSLLSKQMHEKHIVRNSDLYKTQNNERIVLNLDNSVAVQYNIMKRVFTLNKLILKRIYEILHNRVTFYFSRGKDVFCEDRKFLLQYSEQNLGQRSEISDSYRFYFDGLSLQVKIYDQISRCLINKETVYFCDTKSNYSFLLSLIDTLNVKGDITKFVIISDGCAEIDEVSSPMCHIDLRQLCESRGVLSVDDELHILVKAILNSRIKSLSIHSSNLGTSLLNYYSELFHEVGIEVFSYQT